MIKAPAKPLPDDIDSLRSLCEKKDQRIAQLEQMVHYLKLKQYGSSSERYVPPEQETLFDEAEQLVDEAEKPIDDCAESNLSTASTEKDSSPAQKRGRRPLPSNLPRHKIYHNLAPEKTRCDCGCELSVIDEVISEQLAVIPADMYVVQHCRKKYICSNCPERPPVTAPLPPQPMSLS